MSDPFTVAAEPLSQLAMASPPLGLVGGIGMTEVRVYSQRPGPDGTFSGCPHVHAVVDEAYYVLSGSGYAEFHDPVAGMRRVELETGTYVHFPPLVMHRLVSGEDLVILGVMSAAGLAEKGEARVYFGPAVDRDPAEYERLMSLPRRDGLAGALERRDAAVAAYQNLVRLFDSDRDAYDAELRRFFGVHSLAMAHRRAEFIAQLESGPLAWAGHIRRRIDSLPAPALPDGARAPDVRQNLPGSESAFGMCGVLRPMLRLGDVR
jgi:mannose-6-phosphate isomerase-like protein (cupin superfamily)